MPDVDEVTERSCAKLDMEEKRREEPCAQATCTAMLGHGELHLRPCCASPCPCLALASSSGGGNGGGGPGHRLEETRGGRWRRREEVTSGGAQGGHWRIRRCEGSPVEVAWPRRELASRGGAIMSERGDERKR